MPMAQITLPLGRLQPVSSRTHARMFSNTASTVDIEAKTMNRKKIEPQIRPPAMLLNTVAMVSNSYAKKALHQAQKSSYWTMPSNIDM